MAYLRDLLKNVTFLCMQGSVDGSVSTVSQDSREVSVNGMFICISGASVDGHDYVSQAIQNGATVCVTAKPIQVDESVTVIRVKDTKEAMAHIAIAFYGNPASAMRMIGITGTKGKTTTAYMLYQILLQAGRKVGLIGTLGIMYNDDCYRRNMNTTPDALTLQHQLREMADAGCTYCVMEVSSQGLKEHRVDGITFEIGIFTNLSPDHIGTAEHGSFKEYAVCKRKLFTQSRYCLVNADDAYASFMVRYIREGIITYGIKQECLYRGSDVTYIRDKSRLCMNFWLHGQGIYDSQSKVPGALRMEIGMPGIVNVYNALAAIAAARTLSIDIHDIADALRRIRVKGRIEEVSCGCSFDVIIDYAHNATSLEQLLITLREYQPVRLIVVFGCGGNRSSLRRYQMGEVAGRLADITVLTSDNPRYEKPEQIIADIVKGMKKTDGIYYIYPDRREAIAYAMSIGKAGDLIVVAGKGHEEYQEIEGRFYPMDERQMILESIRGE